MLIILDLTAYIKEDGLRESDSKTLSMPMWMNERSEKLGINCSKNFARRFINKIIVKKLIE